MISTDSFVVQGDCYLSICLKNNTGDYTALYFTSRCNSSFLSAGIGFKTYSDCPPSAPSCETLDKFIPFEGIVLSDSIAHTYNGSSYNPISGKGVKAALDALSIPTLTSTYSATDTTKAVTGKAVASAISGLSAGSSFTLTSTYSATDTTQAISGKGVKAAFDTYITSSYSATDSTKAVTGSAVAKAISGLSTGSSVALTSTYSATDTTQAITGKGVKAALDTLSIPSLTSTYTATNTTNAVTGKAVASAISTCVKLVVCTAASQIPSATNQAANTIYALVQN